MIQDRNIDWLRKRKRYGPLELNGLITAAVAEGGTDTFTEGELLQNPKASSKTAPDFFLREVADYGIVGLGCAEGDIIYGNIPCPYDLDPNFSVGFRLQFTQSEAVSVGVTWLLKVGVDKAGAVIQAEDAAGIAALDTALTEKNAGGSAWEKLWTSRGIKNSIGLTRAEILDGADIRLYIEPDTVDATIDNVTLIQLEIDYVPIKTQGAGAEHDLPLTSQI